MTIDGVRVVIDSGLRRSPAYDVQTGKFRGVSLQHVPDAVSIQSPEVQSKSQHFIMSYPLDFHMQVSIVSR